jgi:thioredoxin-like negative regulator of GroEL
MQWLVEDGAWDRARELLGAIPPEIRTNARLRRERLFLLERAGLAAQELDEEWNELLFDFDEDISLYQERYDSLRAAKRHPEAAEVLRRARKLDADDPYLNARLVEVLSEEGNVEAIESLLHVFFAPSETSDWPVDYSWEAAKRANLQEAAFGAVRRKLEEGARPTPRAMTVMATFARERAGGARDVLALLETADAMPWMDGRYRSRILGVLCDYGHFDLVARYWREHRSEAESDAESWAQVARALIELGRKRAARALLAGWPDRAGVAMWMVANYVNSFGGVRANDLESIRSNCARALSGLPHDHCARYMAHILAESCVLLGDTEGFLETWKGYRGYFEGNRDDNEYFHGRRAYLLEDIPRLAGFLERNQRWRFRLSCLRLRIRRGETDLRSSSLGKRMKRVPGVLWWLLVIGILSVLVNL